MNIQTEYGLRVTGYGLNSQSEIRNLQSTSDDKKLREILQEFESIFLYYLLKEMRNTIPKTGLFDGGRAEEFFQEILDEELSKHLSRANGIGIAQMLYKQLSHR